MAGRVHGRGQVWQGGMHGRGACMVGGMHGRWGMRGREGMCMAREHAWWEVCMAHMPLTLRDAVNERAVRILLECILVFSSSGFKIFMTQDRILGSGNET